MKELIKDITKKSQDKENIPFSDFVKVIVLMISLSAILVPHMYIKNQIYYKSVRINKLEKSLIHLQNENKILKIKYNRILFRNIN